MVGKDGLFLLRFQAMKVTCQSCGASYAIADDKVSGRLVKVRCKSCRNPIVVDGRQAQPEAPASPAAPSQKKPASVAPPANRPASTPAPAPDSGGDVWSVNLSETDSRTMTVPEIVEAFRRGELGEAFVWKDGMTDWKPLLEVPELGARLKAQGGPSQPPAYDFGVKPHTAPGSTAYAEPAPPEAAKPAAARVSGARGQSQDLFGAVDRAGSEEEAHHDHLADMSEQHRLTGARNENSVLFSLDALKAGLVGQAGAKPAASGAKPAAPKPPSAAKPPGRPPAPSAPGIPAGAPEKARQLDDVMNIGGGNALFSMGADHALLTAPAPPEPKPEPKPVVVAPGGAVSPAMYVQAPPARGKTALLVALAGAFGLIGVGGVVAAVVMSQKTKAELAAKADVSAPVASVATAAPVKSATPAASAAPAESVAATESDGGTQASSAPAAPLRPLTEEEKKKYAEAKKKTDEEKTKKVDEDKEKKEKENKATAAGFDKNAAVSALTSAASAAAACKRPDGPTGAGKVSVTFAPSGRATNAVISGGSFAGTSVGGCIASVFRRARVPAFSGDPVTVSKSFSISP
jgi:predicted Zn finger-like uncharacterized protein